MITVTYTTTWVPEAPITGNFNPDEVKTITFDSMEKYTAWAIDLADKITVISVE